MKLEFTPFEAEQPLRGMKLQEKDAQKDKVCWKSVQKEPKEKMCQLILELQPFRLQFKGKDSMGVEFRSLAVQGKKLLIQKSL